MFQGAESNCPTMPLAEAVSSLLEEISVLDTEHRVASPLQVMLALELYVKQFDLAAQQDAAEALAHLASALQEERLVFFQRCRSYVQSLLDASSTLINRGSFNAIHMDNGNRTEQSALHFWRQHLHWPMEGTMGSLLTCQQCGFQFSMQFESFHDVPLSLPQTADGNIVEGCTIEDCLDRYTAPECITHVRCSRCSHMSAVRSLQTKEGVDKRVLQAVIQKIEDCVFDSDCSCETLMVQQGEVWRNAVINAFKQLRFGHCPEVLCLHVQRAVISRAGDLMKWTGHVSFPLVLNLFPYTMSAQGHVAEKFRSSADSQLRLPGEGQVFHKLLWQKEESELQSKGDSYVYRMPSSTDESTFDDANPSISSGSEDLASESSFESMSRRFVHEMVADFHEAIHPEECANSTGYCNLRSEAIGARMVGLSEKGHSNVLSTVDTENAVAVCEALACLPVTSSSGQEQTIGILKSQGIPSQFHDSACNMTWFDPCLQKTRGTHPLLHNLRSTSASQKCSSISMPSVVNGNVEVPYRGLSKVVDDSCYPGRWFYELISVVVHHGCPKNGHYTVYRKVKVLPKTVDSINSETDIDPEQSQLFNGKQDGVADSSAAIKISKLNCDHQMEDSPMNGDCMDFGACDKREGENACVNTHVDDSCTAIHSSKCNCDEQMDKSCSLDSGACGESAGERESINASCTPDVYVHPDVLVDTPVECPTIREDKVLWFRVSDSHVDIVAEEEVLMAQATLLFYERCYKAVDANNMCRE